MHTISIVTRLARLPGGGRTYVIGAVLLIVGYIALDWASYVYPLGPFNVTPWNPTPALAIVWLMLGGVWYAPVVYAAAFSVDILIRGASGGLWLTSITSAVFAVGYSGIAWSLFRACGTVMSSYDTRRLWMFVAITVVGTALVSLFYIGVLREAGFFGEKDFFTAVLRFWIGDAVGVLVTAPLLLLGVDVKLREKLMRSWRNPETVVQFVVLASTVSGIFGFTGDPARYFYLLFLPLIWIALRGGLPNAVLASAIVQSGVVLGAHVGELSSLTVVEIQARLAAFTLTGLFLGMMVDERERAAAQLRRSMQLAAAGEMAGAIAHELKQPLAALANYASACTLMIGQGEEANPGSRLADTIGKMHRESIRAGDVVARLRDFFLSGTTRIEMVTSDALMASSWLIGESLRSDAGVEFEATMEGEGITLEIDRLQVELVLRNLIDNAFEAVAQQRAGERRVRVSAEVRGGDLVLRVTDSGPGVSPALAERIFDPFVSGKATGMGMGLAMSQAIVQAQGGSLTIKPGNHGEFILHLPGRRKDV